MNLDRLFQAGVFIAVVGVVWTVWPEGGSAAYISPNRIRHSTYRHGPTVLIDRGHWNRPAGDPKLDGLIRILGWDGYQISRNYQEFVPELLHGAWVLVVSDAMGWKGTLDLAGLGLHPRAFTAGEVACVRDWVRRGGALFLIADRPPAGAASQSLAGAFGMTLSDAAVAPARLNPPGEMLEDVAYVWSFGGGTVTGPPGSSRFLNGQAVAQEFGSGRVAAVTAELAGPRRSDNRQLILNIMHWLCRTE